MKSKKLGFTLAEVLITLGIIGVVAALTLPTLIQNHRKSAIETSLAKFYSTINQAIQRAEVEYGDKTTWKIADTEEFWEKYLKPYIQYLEIEDITLSEVRPAKIVYLPDGSAVRIDVYYRLASDGSVADKTEGGHFLFAPNAKTFKTLSDKTKTPKELIGTKIFYFAFWPNEPVKEEKMDGKDYINSDDTFKYHRGKGVEPYKAHWNGDPEQLYKNSIFGCSQTTSEPLLCTAIIQQNGWKIPDDYPFKL